MNVKANRIRRFFWVAGALLLLGGGYSVIFGTKEKFSKPERTIELVEELELTLPKKFRSLKIWMPVPKTDLYQETEILKVESPFEGQITEEREFGNRLLFFEPKKPWNKTKAKIKIHYKVVRKEQRGRRGETATTDGSALSEYLKERGLERINEKIRRIEKEITKGKRKPIMKARAIYDFVLKHMQYDKSGTGWGRGDSVYACDIGKGNCTDFHSLFIALSRASRIPARFQMGIPLPPEPEGKPASDYHCWAEFYMDGIGWIPVDISEAWKNRKKEEYFFGNLDVDRVLISTGREIELSPKQSSAPLNYLSKAYIELNNKPLENFEFRRIFRDLN